MTLGDIVDSIMNSDSVRFVSSCTEKVGNGLGYLYNAASSGYDRFSEYICTKDIEFPDYINDSFSGLKEIGKDYFRGFLPLLTLLAVPTAIRMGNKLYNHILDNPTNLWKAIPLALGVASAAALTLSYAPQISYVISKALPILAVTNILDLGYERSLTLRNSSNNCRNHTI